MFFINKIVGWCFSPLGVLFVGHAVGWMFCLAGARVKKFAWLVKVGKCVSIGAIVVGWVLCCEVATRFIGVPLEREFVSDNGMCGSILGDNSVDAIVLLGGGIGAHRQCHAVELMQGSDRVLKAAELWKIEIAKGRSLKIYCTGGGVEFGTIPFLRDLGVLSDAVEFSENPRNTEEEAAWLVSRGVKRIALVTSAWHMKRARMLFKRHGFEVVPIPTDFEMSYVAESDVAIKEFFPSVDGVMRNTAAMKEWIALAFYGILRRK